MGNSELVEQLKDVGDRLLLPPSSSPQLLTLLDEVVLLLSKVGQAPSQVVQDALLSTMKALISDQLLHNSDGDVNITVTACLNELLRISAPHAPYDDQKMKEIFELIVSSFDKLSCPPGRCYSKAILILESVARIRSCVMMLDLDCYSLITKMFQLFHKHVSSNHPHSVFLAMAKIMSVMIKESDSLSEELLKVLLESIRKENQNASPESFNLGAKVIEECSEKLKPYIVEVVKLTGCCLEDYAPILSSICETEPLDLTDLVHDSAKHLVNSEPATEELHSAENVQHLKVIERCSEKAGTDSETASESGGKLYPHDPDEGDESLGGKEKTSCGSPHGHVKRNMGAQRSKKSVPAVGDELSKRETEQAADLDNKKVHQATSLGGSSEKKAKPPKKDGSGGSRTKSTTGLSRKEKIQTSDDFRSQKKRATSDDDVIETPHGRKNYKEDLVGCRIKVWWPLDRRYYEGTISSFDAFTRKHKIEYDDGDEEVLNLRTEQWEFLGDEVPTDIDLFAVKKSPQPRPNMSKREASTVRKKETSQTNNAKKSSVLPDCEVVASVGTHQAAKNVEKMKIPEDLSEAKRARLSDEHNS